MPMVFIRHVGANLAYIQALDAIDPGFGVGGGGVDPGYGHPDWAGGHPGNALPGYGHPGNRPPGSWGGEYPSHGLPGSPGHPDSRPPASRPPVVAAGQTLVLVRDPEGIWHYATVDASTPPPKPVPVPPPDYATGQPVPPTATPTKK